MLTVITLYAIDKIFNEDIDFKLSPMAKLLYINSLIYHFKDKKPTTANAVAFDMFKNDVPNYEKYERLFQELHKAGLVTIGLSEIRFNNFWGKHIDRTKLDKVTPEEFVAGYQFGSPLQYKEELLNNSSLFDILQMRHKITKEKIIEWIEVFMKEQEAFGKKYSGATDCIKHFTYWMPSALSGHKDNNIDGGKVKTGAKILGLDPKGKK